MTPARRLLLTTFLLAYAGTAFGQADALRISEVHLGEGWVELVNTGTETVDAGMLWLCTRPSYARIGDLSVVGGGSLSVAPAARLVVSWTPTRNADGDDATADGEVGLYTSGPFTVADNMIDYVAFGAAQSDGRASVADEAGVWTGGAFAPAPSESRSLARFTQGLVAPDAAPVDQWRPGVPTPNASNVGLGPDVDLQLVVDGLTAPVLLREVPDGSGRLFVVDQAGVIHVIDADGALLDTPFLDVRDRMVTLSSGFDERGLLGLAFHPDFASNGRFFVYYSAPLREDAPDGYNHTSRVSAFTVDGSNPNRADPASEEVLLQVDEPQFNHNAGALGVGPDGHLYVALGDGGDADDTGLGHLADWYDANEGGNAQNVTTLLGKILRVDVSGGAEPFGVPSDNPFVGTEGEDAIYAYGFRNPYRLSFDQGGAGALFVADVGQNRWEEISMVTLGGNYGWNVREAAHCFDTENPDADRATCPDAVDAPGAPHDGDVLIDPVIEYQNSNQENGLGLAVVGGFVYRGGTVPALSGWYIFGDWSADGSPNGRLFAAPLQDPASLWTFAELSLPDAEGGQLGAYLLGFGQDSEGEVYVLTTANTGPTGTTGAVHRLAPAGGATPVADAPEVPTTDRLSQNFPNPFNPSTTIPFDLATAGEVTLAVYDVLGRRVVTLVNRALPAGGHQAVWDGRSADGQPVVSGVYLVRLEAGPTTRTRAVTLLK